MITVKKTALVGLIFAILGDGIISYLK